MKTTRLARRLGLDGNPLRRRIDKIEACLATLTLVVFLTGAPVLSVAAGRAWVRGHPERQVSAVLLRAAPPGSQTGSQRQQTSGHAGRS